MGKEEEEIFHMILEWPRGNMFLVHSYPWISSCSSREKAYRLHLLSWSIFYNLESDPQSFEDRNTIRTFSKKLGLQWPNYKIRKPIYFLIIKKKNLLFGWEKSMHICNQYIYSPWQEPLGSHNNNQKNNNNIMKWIIMMNEIMQWSQEKARRNKYVIPIRLTWSDVQADFRILMVASDRKSKPTVLRKKGIYWFIQWREP